VCAGCTIVESGGPFPGPDVFVDIYTRTHVLAFKFVVVVVVVLNIYTHFATGSRAISAPMSREPLRPRPPIIWRRSCSGLPSREGCPSRKVAELRRPARPAKNCVNRTCKYNNYLFAFKKKKTYFIDLRDMLRS